MMPPTRSGKDNSCLSLVIETNLATVNAGVLATTEVGEHLPVAARSVDGPVVVLKDGEVLGSVLSSRLIQLLNCMNEGTEYEAEIVKLEGAVCQVKISAVR